MADAIPGLPDPTLTNGAFINPAYATPEQRKMLYQYGNELMKPQPIKSGWQGLAAIANALMGGYSLHQADLAEQAASMQGKTDIARGIGAIAAPGTSASIPPPYDAAPLAASPVSPVSSAGSALSDLKNGVARIEGGDYHAMGPVTASGDRAYGRYQVMGSNVGPWTKEVLGKSLSPAEFLKDQGAQEAIASAKLGQYLTQYGNPRDAASVWFTGRPLGQGGAAATDQNGMTGARYAALAAGGAGGTVPGGAAPMVGSNATHGPPSWQDVLADNSAWDETKAANLARAAAAGNAFAPPLAPAGAVPAAAAIGTPRPGLPTLAQPARPMAMAQNAGGGLPVSAGAIGELLGNPNIDPEVKRYAQELLQPKPMTDITGNTYISRQFQPPPQAAPPFFAAGAPGQPSNIGGVGLGTIITGTPGAPNVTTVGPGVVDRTNAGPAAAPAPLPPAGSPGAGAPTLGQKLFDPNSPVGSIIAAKQAADARGAATTTAAGGSAESYVNDMRAATNYQRSKLPLEQAIPALERLGSTGTGPGSETWNHYMSFLQTLGIPGLDTSKIKDFDEAKKYLTDYVNQNGDRGTNDKLAASFAGSPSTSISNAAAIDVAKTALTMQRFKQAQVMAFSGERDPQTGQPTGPDKYLQYATSYQQTHDPRAYGLDLMSRTAKDALYRELKANPTSAAKFKQSYDEALSLGLAPAPTR